jgi:hypothetical protein
MSKNSSISRRLKCRVYTRRLQPLRPLRDDACFIRALDLEIKTRPVQPWKTSAKSSQIAARRTVGNVSFSRCSSQRAVQRYDRQLRIAEGAFPNLSIRSGRGNGKCGRTVSHPRHSSTSNVESSPPACKVGSPRPLR